MHPDKNGGTEEAKERFQEMKAVYDAVKEALEKGIKEDIKDLSQEAVQRDVDDVEAAEKRMNDLHPGKTQFKKSEVFTKHREAARAVTKLTKDYFRTPEEGDEQNTGEQWCQGDRRE